MSHALPPDHPSKSSQTSEQTKKEEKNLWTAALWARSVVLPVEFQEFKKEKTLFFHHIFFSLLSLWLIQSSDFISFSLNATFQGVCLSKDETMQSIKLSPEPVLVCDVKSHNYEAQISRSLTCSLSFFLNPSLMFEPESVLLFVVFFTHSTFNTKQNQLTQLSV